MSAAETDGATETNCVFCQIVAGSIPAEVVHRTEGTVAFRDTNPQARVHVLVVPREHYTDAADVAERAPDVAAELLRAASVIADQEGLDQGYRMVFNTGPAGGQVVYHTHLHVLGGQQMGWPPG